MSGEDSTSSATSSPATGAESGGPGAPAGRADVLGEIRQQRIDKVHQLREQGIDPYPPDAVDRVSIARAREIADGEPALRLGMCLVKSLSEAGAERLVLARRARAFASVQDLAARAQLDRGDLEALAAAVGDVANAAVYTRPPTRTRPALRRKRADVP